MGCVLEIGGKKNTGRTTILEPEMVQSRMYCRVEHLKTNFKAGSEIFKCKVGTPRTDRSNQNTGEKRKSYARRYVEGVHRVLSSVRLPTPPDHMSMTFSEEWISFATYQESWKSCDKNTGRRGANQIASATVRVVVVGPTKVRKYGNRIRKYESTKVRKYFRTFVRKYFRTKVSTVAIYCTFEDTFVRRYLNSTEVVVQRCSTTTVRVHLLSYARCTERSIIFVNCLWMEVRVRNKVLSKVKSYESSCTSI